MQLSYHAKQVLQQNGYQLDIRDNQICFKYSSFDRLFILVFGFLLSLFSSFLIINTPIFFTIIFIVIAVVTYVTYRRANGKSAFTIFYQQNKFSYNKYESDLSAIDSIKVSSELMTGYGVAYQEVDEEHKIVVSLMIDSQNKFDVFTFKNIGEESSKAINEIILLLEQVVDRYKQ